MIHKRFNYTKKICWAGILLTLFFSSAVTVKDKEISNSDITNQTIVPQHFLTESNSVIQASLPNSVVTK